MLNVPINVRLDFVKYVSVKSIPLSEKDVQFAINSLEDHIYRMTPSLFVVSNENQLKKLKEEAYRYAIMCEEEDT
jgi:hypothetical protein